ncbi:Lateral organ boundaries domain containing protein [Parasponia andersonii]|uniref:Lateral organ boundaries domain containing protein n=1 Tax=Parasponia andersonii TaxID=3476 RepID=A0A2P5AD16_PARAD|nr:Lateral organ boundaries domain containing protein [Parasponia andersonii]
MSGVAHGEDHSTGASDNRRNKATTKRTTAAPPDQLEPTTATAAPVPPAPCGACKFLRRKCISGCIFAPHFGSAQGAARFAAVHKVFGASNVSKLLLHIPVNRRHDAVVTISYEAQARLADPVYGCVSTILALQQQVASLQSELAMVQNQLMSSRFAFANALQSSQQQQHPQQLQQHTVGVLQPAYSNNSSASNNLINMTSFTSNFDLAAATADTTPSSHSLEPLQLSRPSHDEEDDEEESRIPHVYPNEIIHRG